MTVACDKGRFNVAKLLIERAADVNISGEVASLKFCIIDSISVVLNQDSRGFGWSPLMVASSRGHYEICKLLLEHGAAVNLPLKVTFSGRNH